MIQAYGHEAQTVDLKKAADTVPEGFDDVIVAASDHLPRRSARALCPERENDQ